jgi:hypothetical protein
MAHNPAFHALLSRMGETHDKKNHDYAEDGNPYSNFEFAAQFAGVSVQQVFDVMIGIKQARLLVLTQSGKNRTTRASRTPGWIRRSTPP